MAPRVTKKTVKKVAAKAVKAVKKVARKAEPAPAAVRLPALHESTTSSGLKVLAAQRGVLPLVAMRLVIRAGSSVDPADKHGLSDFTARLMRRGTAKMSADELDETIEFVGASFSVGSSEDVLSLFVTTPAEHFPDMLAVLGQLVREPSFPEREVELARERALAGFVNDLDDPSVVADRAFTRALWGNHPYGHDVGGSAAHVKTFTRDDLVRFHRERMGPRVALLSVVGAVDPELSDASVRPELMEQIARYTGGKAFRLPMNGLPDDLPLLDPPVVEVGRAKDRPLWDRWYYLVALVGLLGTEWFLRRRFGYV